MKHRGRGKRLRAATGRGDRRGDGSQIRLGYWYALLLTRGSTEARSWTNISGDAVAEPGFDERLGELLAQWRVSPSGPHALITLSKAQTFTAGLALCPLSTVEAAKFFSRHPEHTLKVILEFPGVRS